MERANVVVLGAGYAGLMAALRLRRRAPGANVTLVDANDTFVERIRLHQVVGGERFGRPIAQFLDGTGVRFVRARVTAIDLQRRAVQLDGAEEISYDKLVYALGSATDSARAPGAAEHCHTLDAASAARLGAELPKVAARGGRLCVVGGGLTGVEAATELAEKFPSLKVSLVSSGEVGAGLSAKARAHILKALARLNIELVEHAPVTRVGACELTAGGIERPFDLCLWTGGFKVSSLAQKAGLEVDEQGLIKVDSCLRARGREEVYAVGDAALPESAPHDMSCQAAMPMGCHAADNLARALAGKIERPFYFSFILRCISLGRKDGVVQRLTADGRGPNGFVVTGRFAAFIKERICRYTVTMLRLTRRWAGAYRWSRPAPSLPARDDAKRLAA